MDKHCYYKCIAQDNVRNRFKDCPAGEDEEMCVDWCSAGCICSHHTAQCNNLMLHNVPKQIASVRNLISLTMKGNLLSDVDYH